MAMTLQELGRRTPPTFYPLTDPFPAPVFGLGQMRAKELPAIPAATERDEALPCRCRRCHRLLRSVASVAAGIGPSCEKKEGSAPAALPLFALNGEVA